MNHVPNHAIVTNCGVAKGCGVNHRPILNAGALTNNDCPVVSAKHSAWPNAAVGTNGDRANDNGVGVNIRSGMN
jgi:hypothetical protein